MTFTVDAYPNDTFEGVVKQVRQEATTTNNVVTYEVVISAPNSELKLKPGLTANVTIYTAERKNVVSVPSKALRFTPTKDLVKGIKIVDCNGKNKVWTKEGNTFRAHAVQIGMTDGINTEILSGIKQGQEVVTDCKAQTAEPESSTGGEGESSPFQPKGPGQKKK